MCPRPNFEHTPPMSDNTKIRAYDTRAFTDKYIPAEELKAFFRGDYNRFLLMPVEEMYPHVQGDVPASRSTTHILIYFTKGEGYMKIGHDEYQAKAGEMLVVPAGQVFSFEAYEESKFNKGYICTFHEDLFADKYHKRGVLHEFDFLKVWGQHHIHFNPTDAQDISLLFELLLAEYQYHALSRPPMIQTHFLALLTRIRMATDSGANTPNEAGAHLVNGFRELLFKHIRTTHTAAAYADMLHVSPNHLNKTIKGATGKTVSKWIDEALLLEAKVLLYQTDLSVGAVAAEIGITDASYFSRLFKKYEGITPAQYRKK